MRSSFIFCLLTMGYIASANAISCWGIPSAPCRLLCQDDNGWDDLTTKNPGTPCRMPGVKEGTCDGGECKKKQKN
uniref:Putative secreted protein n=1 Tax=Ixodes ricinus TaxID=34613 RepID=V5GVY4_IXORI